MTTRTLTLTDALYGYLHSVGWRESDNLVTLREMTAQRSDANMQIAPEQGQFMALLVQLLGARRIIEIGVFTGYSTLSMAEVLPEDGYILACDVNPESTGIARRYWQAAGVDGKINLQLAPALETLNNVLTDGEAGTFDMVFIDADKSSYDDYYECCLKLLRPGGLVILDNMLWSGRVADEGGDADTDALKVMNRKIHQDERVDMVLLPLADGVTLARKR
ncbi:class I SAM-dependent methyltransferase [Kistimonas asteriae]|uniref:class I SAM-dependent methyltransferase n=1 Tax=Kistimonas asteriae TaxID=517724 RepID=UPI001BA5C642|nr:class I SAM-dependent methyltransferase [Kistimonas asteriae]